MSEREKTPQAEGTKVDALKLGADLIERLIEENRARARHGANSEGSFLDAVQYGVALGRLRAMAEYEEPKDG
jgi:hypothetical protein